VALQLALQRGRRQCLGPQAHGHRHGRAQVPTWPCRRARGALRGGGSVPRFRTAYLRTDRRSARVLSESVYDSTLRHPSARSGRRGPSGGCLPGAISSRPRPDPRIRPAGQARKHRRAEPLLPASAARGLLPCCLCTNMWITCAQRRRACAYAVEMLGIPLPVPQPDSTFTWESASRTLCMQRKTELSTCHPAIDNK